MALYHKATLSPTKAELLAAWVPTQTWCPDPSAPIEVIGAYRFDDPEGKVGMELHLVRCGGDVLHVQLKYRDAPVDGLQPAAQMEHSALGTRWVYDGLDDERLLVMLAGAALTGQGEALGMVFVAGEWLIAPAAVRIRGGGWSQKRVSVDGFEPVSGDSPSQVFQNERFELVVYRQPEDRPQPRMGLSASWDNWSSSVVLAEIKER